MKAILSCIFLVLLTAATQSQVVNIPDANFKNALLNHTPVIDVNGNGEIEESEAFAFTGTMDVSHKSISDLTGIQAFDNLSMLNCSSNLLTTLPVSGMSGLQSLVCSINIFGTLNLSNMPSLKELTCQQNQLTSIFLANVPALQTLRCSINNIANLSLTDLPSLQILDCGANGLVSLSLGNINTLQALDCSSNYLTALPFDAMPDLRILSCYNNLFSTLPINNLVNLETINCDKNNLTTLPLGNPAALKTLNCSYNQLTSLPAGMNSLERLVCTNNQITALNLQDASQLNYLDFHSNLVAGFSLSNKPLLTDLNCRDNLLSSLELQALPTLAFLTCDTNKISTLSLNDLPGLRVVFCTNNLLTHIALTDLPLLSDLYCNKNYLTDLQLNDLPSFNTADCSFNQLGSLQVNNCPILEYLYCARNQLTSLSLTNIPSLKLIDCSFNKLNSLVLEDYSSLQFIACNNNKITSLNLHDLPALQILYAQRNEYDSLKITDFPSLTRMNCGANDSVRSVRLNNLPMLTRFQCDSTNLRSLDLSETAVKQLDCNTSPSLRYINIKNGAISDNTVNNNLTFSSLDSLVNICADDNELAYVSSIVSTQLPGQSVGVSSLCNFDPNANYNMISGNVRFDGNGNGCDMQDSSMSNVKITLNDGTQTGSTFTDVAGNYKFLVLQSTNTLVPSFENPYFTAAPLSQTISFSNVGETQHSDFCVSPNGVHADLEIVLQPLSIARPGFDAQYKLIYRNKGNQVQAGTVTLDFDAARLNLVSALPVFTSQTTGNLLWSFTGLSPYETKVINLTFHVNLPPAANLGDVLSFTGIINPIPHDDTPLDNIFNLRQIVRNSYDPNDKDVTEGSSIHISKAGEYLHYVIRFQNTGNEPAITVRVKDSLADNLDWNSFMPLSSSHAYRVVINKGNKVEFIFDDINLPGKNTNDPASHGFISFKIKPKPLINIGETIYNTAEIYFDYNLPVITNTVATTIIDVDKKDNPIGLTVFPNPPKDYIWITVNAGVQVTAINLYDMAGKKIYTGSVDIQGVDKKINLSNLPAGIFYLEVISQQGRSVKKIVRIK